MKTKRLFNTSEYKTFNEIRKSLEGEGFYLHPEMQIGKVIEPDKRERITKEERNTLDNAFFDFVIYNKELWPEFVIEFDGPCHSHFKNRQRDIRKNRICEQANLPLLRIDDSLLTEYEEVSLLGYIVRRFVTYRKNIGKISLGVNERLSCARSSGDVNYDDPWYDPDVIFDLNHPFPVSIEIAEGLYKDYGIVTNHIDTETYHNATSQYPYLEFHWGGGSGDGPISDYARRLERRYRLEKHVQDSFGKYNSEIIHELSMIVDYSWGVPAGDETDSRNILTTISHVHFQCIPGTSMFQLAEHLCDFLAIRELEKWAKNNLIK